MKDFPARSLTLSQNSSWHDMTRSPFLQSRACNIEKLVLHPSHSLGSSGGSMPYLRNRASHHSCSPSSMPFTVDGCIVSHAPVFVTRRKRHATEVGGIR